MMKIRRIGHHLPKWKLLFYLVIFSVFVRLCSFSKLLQLLGPKELIHLQKIYAYKTLTETTVIQFKRKTIINTKQIFTNKSKNNK